MLTVLCWLWAQPGGRTQYEALHVNVWAAMVRRNLTIPHRLACVTDTPAGIDPSVGIIPPPRDFEDERLSTWRADRPQCLRRLAMFRRDAGAIFGERFVCMDVDCVVDGNLDGLFSRSEDIVLYATPNAASHNCRPYNGSLLMMTAGARPHVYETFSTEAAEEAGRRYLGSDQAWISHVLGPNEATWGIGDGVVWWGHWRARAGYRLVFFQGHPKPWDIVGRNEWVRQRYRRGSAGRCLVLGHGETLWPDVDRALVGGRGFDAVIASPEAAEHWPGPVAAVARDDAHALELASMMGFDDVAFCGRSDLLAA